VKPEGTCLERWLNVCDTLEGFGWRAVDFDGTLVNNSHSKPRDPYEIHGEPIAAMVDTVKEWIAHGVKVCLFTARIGPTDDVRDVARVRTKLQGWCLEHLGIVIPITCIKSHHIEAIYDDRAFRVTRNQGIIE